MPAEVGIDAGTNYVSLSVPNEVSAPMGVELSLPVVAAGDNGLSLRFGLDGGGNEEPAVASLQAIVNGSWVEVGRRLVVGGGLVDIELLNMGLPVGTQLKVVASTIKGVALAVSDFEYATITKAVQTYMALSCDTDAAWGLAARGFNGQLRMDELAGKGNWYTATYWEYNAPLGRRMNVDPVDQISISNYAVNRNNPIAFSDPDGDQVRSDKGTESNPQTLQEVVIKSTRTGGARTAAGLDDALDGYVARKSAMDNTPFSERTGNKYYYAAYNLRQDKQRQDQARSDSWTKAVEEGYLPLLIEAYVEADSYIAAYFKVTHEGVINGKPGKLVLPWGAQYTISTEPGKTGGDFIDPLNGVYVNYKKNEIFDMRIIPATGITRGDYQPGLRVLATTPYRYGPIKTQADFGLTKKALGIGIRGVVETPSKFMGRNIPYTAEAVLGGRFRFSFKIR